MYHPAACHASTVGPDGRQFKRRAGDEGGDAAFFAPNGEAVVAQTGVRGLNNRHSSEASLFDKEQSGGHWDDYRAIMVTPLRRAAHGGHPEESPPQHDLLPEPPTSCWRRPPSA